MSRRVRAATALVLAVGGALWMAAALHGWWVERAVRDAGRIDGETGAVAAVPQLPWSGAAAARRWAHRVLLTGAGQTETVDGLLAASLRDRPLHAPTWLDYADWLKSRGEIERAARLVDQGRALWPGRPRLLWRAVLLQLELGDFERAFDALRDYWAVEPGDGLRVLGLMRRLDPDAQALAAASEAAWSSGVAEPLVYQRQLLAVAARTADQELAAALWARLDEAARQNPELLFPYLQVLLDGRHYQAVDRVWEQATGAPPGLYNGGFEQPLLDGGLGWRHRDSGEGFRVARQDGQSFGGDHAIRIEFMGTHNVNFSHLSQLMRVQPGRRYRLSGYWSGHELTTRSGVFVELYTVAGEQPARARLEPRWGTWAWEPFELDIEVPDDAGLLAVRVRRQATDALDRLIGGTLRLDELALRPVQ